MISALTRSLHPENIRIQALSDPRLRDAGVEVDVLRLDLIHPVISGNKWYKLAGYFQKAIKENADTLVTFGGAWSNHLVATAATAARTGMKSIGIIRGEEAPMSSETLMECRMYGMQLHFIPRKIYDDPIQRQRIAENIIGISKSIIVPMGGHGEEGLAAWKGLLNQWNHPAYTHLIAAVGSGTMITALSLFSISGQKIIGYPAMEDPNLPNEIRKLLKSSAIEKQEPALRNSYNRKGYAKTDEALLHFMNELYQQESLPTDIVYTGKMMFGIHSDINKGFYPPGSRLLAIHSGGLQGNRSLPPGTLRF